jgi:hypothetical protein
MHWYDDGESPVSDAYLPSQQSRRVAEPEYLGLFRALLANCIDDLRHMGRCSGRRSCRGCRWREQARRWLVAPANPPYFSFADICEALGLPAVSLRQQLLMGAAAMLRLGHRGSYYAEPRNEYAEAAEAQNDAGRAQRTESGGGATTMAQ